jgi:hypothetical protein
VIKEQVSELRAALADPDSFLAMTNVLEQACNHFLATESWPQTYEEVQPVPVLKVGQLTVRRRGTYTLAAWSSPLVSKWLKQRLTWRGNPKGTAACRYKGQTG